MLLIEFIRICHGISDSFILVYGGAVNKDVVYKYNARHKGKYLPEKY